jgi:hypothetical protein
MALSGTIRDFGLADILQLIGIQRKSGILTLENSDDAVTVKFLDGQVVGADTKRRSVEEFLGGVLVSTGRITEPQLAEALRIQKKTLQRLGHILVKGGLISQDDLIEALRVQSLQIIFRLFRWRDGKYSFRTVKHLEYDDRHFIPISSETILMEGARMVDEWPIIERRIKSDKMVLRRTEAGTKLDLSVESIADADIDYGFGFEGSSQGGVAVDERTEKITLTAEEREIMSLVDGNRTAEAINERSTLGEFDSYRILADLMTRNLIEEVKRPTVVAAAEKPRGFLDTALRAVLNGLIVIAVILAVATLRVNPVTPWRVGSGDEGIERLRFYSSQMRLEQLEKAIQIHYLDVGSFPYSLDKLATYGYLAPEDLIDPWGRPYGYAAFEGGYQLSGLNAGGESLEELTIVHKYSGVQRMMEEQSATVAP